MVLMAACGFLLALGLLAVWRWGGLDLRRPPAGTDPGDVARGYVWYLTVGLVAGLGAGLLVAGAGGRLVMRLLAVTSSDEAQGRITEADEIVGEITFGGTVAFIVFTGLFFGLITGVLYLLVRRWLPAGRLGALAFGGLLLVVAGSRVEKLRADNPDFDIVGPLWVSLLAFAALVLAHGMVVAALAARYAAKLPLLAWERTSLVRHAPLVLLVPLIVPALVVVVAGLIVVGLSQVKPIRAAFQAQRATVAIRMALAATALVALPGFVGAASDIASRGP